MLKRLILGTLGLLIAWFLAGLVIAAVAGPPAGTAAG